MRLRSKKELGLPRWVPTLEGTFDDPPLVIWQSRLKVSLMCLGTTMVAGIVYGLGPGDDKHLVLSIVIGLGAGMLGWNVIFRRALILFPGGLVWRTGFRTLKYEWSDFDRFEVGAMPRMTKMVAGVFSASYKGRRPWPWRNVTLCWFGGAWELPQQRIADVLNEARTRWGSKGMAS